MPAGKVDGMLALPRHLWEDILLLLKPPDIGDIRILSLEDCQDVMSAQAEYARLRLVCSQYNEMHKLQKPRSLSLFKKCEGESLCSLLLWLSRHKDSLQSLETTCGDASLDLILGAVASCPLKLIDVGNVGDATLQSVTSCRLLTSCAITIDVPILDILPLQGLPHLTNLLLQGGKFVNFQALVHLTSLYLLGARVESSSDSPCASRLSSLELHQASIAQFHHCGLSACQGLRSLFCENSCMLADVFTDRLLCIPSTCLLPDNASLLTCLTKLTISTYTPGVFTEHTADEDVDIHMTTLSTITALRELKVSSDDVKLVTTLLNSQACVQQLTRLQIDTHLLVWQSVCIVWSCHRADTTDAKYWTLMLTVSLEWFLGAVGEGTAVLIQRVVEPVYISSLLVCTSKMASVHRISDFCKIRVLYNSL